MPHSQALMLLNRVWNHREELTGIGIIVLGSSACASDARRGRLEAAITGGPVGQQMEPACDMGLEAPSCPKANRLLLRSPFLERFRNWLFSREATLAAL
jgi:hypothetical protein